MTIKKREQALRKAEALIRKAEYLLNIWLVDYTHAVFEEEGEIDEARGMLQEALELVEARIASEVAA